jgi:hypothetical protein
MNDDKVDECVICGRQKDSRIDMLRHLKDAHTLQERLAGLITKTQEAEDTYA